MMHVLETTTTVSTPTEARLPSVYTDDMAYRPKTKTPISTLIGARLPSAVDDVQADIPWSPLVQILTLVDEDKERADDRQRHQ